MQNKAELFLYFYVQGRKDMLCDRGGLKCRVENLQ